MCTTIDIGTLFINKPDSLVLAFDTVMNNVMLWQPNYMGPSTKSIIFTNQKAWLIIRPMKDQLDVKFYHKEKIASELIKKYTVHPNKIAHHLRIRDELDVTPDFMRLLKRGYDYAMSD